MKRARSSSGYIPVRWPQTANKHRQEAIDSFGGIRVTVREARKAWKERSMDLLLHKLESIDILAQSGQTWLETAPAGGIDPGDIGQMEIIARAVLGQEFPGGLDADTWRLIARMACQIKFEIDRRAKENGTVGDREAEPEPGE